MDRYTVTAYIRCYRDPGLVLKCASHVKWADELVIADNSGDNSVKDIVSQIAHPNIKYFATDIVDWRLRVNSLKDKMSSDYILMIDTDEFYSEAAGEEILAVLADKQNVNEGYIVPSESFLFGQYYQKGADQLRLFMRDKFYFNNNSVHEMPKVPGKVGKLNNGYDHFNSPTFANQLTKPFTYAMADAKMLTDEQLNKKRVDGYSSVKIKLHFFKILLKLIWRSRGFFFSKNMNFMHLWLRYVDMLVITANDIGPTEEIRIREQK